MKVITGAAIGLLEIVAARSAMLTILAVLAVLAAAAAAAAVVVDSSGGQ